MVKFTGAIECNMYPSKSLIRSGLFFVSTLLLLGACDDDVEKEHPVIAGVSEGMIHQLFDPPLETGYDSVKIQPDPASEATIVFTFSYSGPTGCRNYNPWVSISGSEQVSFHYHHEEHTEYYSEEWKEYIYTWEGIEKDIVLEKWNYFHESDSVVGVRGEEVISVFNPGDTLSNEGSFMEGGSLKYRYGSQIYSSTTTNPGSACRISPDSTGVNGDTTILYFTISHYYFAFDSALYDPEGVYIIFKLEENERERLGWLKLQTSGTRATIYECALQECSCNN